MTRSRPFSIETLEDRTVPAAALTGADVHADHAADATSVATQVVTNATIETTAAAATAQESAASTTLDQMKAAADLYAAQAAEAAQAAADRADPSRGFVRRIYRDFLGRAPDAGAQGYIDALNAGTSRHDVAMAVLDSDEYAARQVDGMFRALLGRGAEQSDIDGYVTALRDGQSIEGLAAEVIGSDEFKTRHAGSTAFLAAVYGHLLGRAPDTPGAAPYADRYAADPSEADEIAAEILDSYEGRQRVGQAAVLLMLRQYPSESFQNKYVLEVINGTPIEHVMAEMADTPTYSDLGRGAATYHGQQHAH